MGEKTEKATPKKLRDAKRKGQIAKSQDFPAAFTFVVSMMVTLAMTDSLYNNLSSVMLTTFKEITGPDLLPTITGMFMNSFYVIFICSIPIMLTVALAGCLVTFITTGPVFSPEVFKFDIKKFNPVDNLKAKFKMKTFVELLKSLLKIFIAAILVYTVMMSSLPVLVKTVELPVAASAQVFVHFLYEVIIKVGIFFVVIAIFDLAYQKHNFEKEMRMEKFEVKQEYKDTEGDPLIKSKRKQIAHEIAYSEGPGMAASRAKAVVTNPTHLAIALGFDKEYDAAPYILTMGRGLIADRIIKIAEDHKVPIVRNIPLAHKLWEEGKLYEYVPEETYEALAEILRWIASLQDDATLANTPTLQM
ncbi:MAG: type III secretion system export apparatus subunit SctU [Verrucomicrobia bacterium]|nr:type III secretion system export apparatus subunit SctU [Verrucomicrobiota bacterium]